MALRQINVCKLRGTAANVISIGRANTYDKSIRRWARGAMMMRGRTKPASLNICTSVS